MDLNSIRTSVRNFVSASSEKYVLSKVGSMVVDVAAVFVCRDGKSSCLGFF